MGNTDETETETEEQRLWKIGVLDLCLGLHMSLSGAADPMRDDEEKSVRAYLRKRLDNWRPSYKRDVRFDNAIRELIESVLAEADATS